MAYKKFQGQRIFNGFELMNDEQVLITDDDGRIEGIVARIDAGDDVLQVEGILSPGFINCHCHLELSHLKNIIPPGTGLVEFLCQVVKKREPSSNSQNGTQGEDAAQKKMAAFADAEREMYDNGIVAVGDTGNTAETAEVKTKSKIRWQNFVEVLGFSDEKAEANIAHFTQVLESMENTLRQSATPHRSTLVPHAPYSISPKTFDLIDARTRNKIISIHNQEHSAEDELYKTGGGEYLRLFKIFGVNESPFPITGKSSIRSYLPHFRQGQTIFLIHNTYTSKEDIDFANEYADEHGLKLVYCLCPNANLYIENKLPPLDLLVDSNCHLVLGTDSYSSNWQLNIAKEIKVLSVPKFESSVSLKNLLQFATINGARALEWDDELGSFDKGKKPGVVLLDTEIWTAKRLI